MDLAGKVALVTGASGDLGRAVAVALARAGADIAVSYVGAADRARETREAVEAEGRRAHELMLDQADPTSISAAVESCAAHFGRLDILVNNAAWNVGVPFHDLDGLTVEVWDRIFATNVRGPFLIARAAASKMQANGAGRIINIASVGGLIPLASSIAYASSKAALIHLTRCLAVALAPAITVNCVAPGLIDGTRTAARAPEPVRELFRARALLGGFTSKVDVADQVVAFARSDTTTGQVVVVDGGVHLH